MKYWYDTEFLEDGRTIDLISIGIVAEDGREYYAVNEDAEAGMRNEGLGIRIRTKPWLMGNVVPSLPLRAKDGITGPYGAGGLPNFYLDMTSPLIKSLRQIRNEVREFLLAAPDPELWAWYGAYDHVVLCQLFGPMISLPEGMPMWTNDFKQEVHQAGNRAIPKQETALHNALEDARWLRNAYMTFHGYGPL